MNKGLVHIYTGDGKGKTTAATGLATRCVGYGKTVCVFRFLKSSYSGELDSLEKLGVKIIQINTSEKFYYDMSDAEKELTCKEIKSKLPYLFEIPFDMIILDELICAVDLGIICIDEIIDIIKTKPLKTELVLTGRNMPDKLLDCADYVSEIKCIKHPYATGVDARCGIDF